MAAQRERDVNLQNQRSAARVVCLIASRNLGDIVVYSAFLKELIARGYAEHYVVWTRPQLAFLFEGLPACSIICSQFPVGTAKAFSFSAAFRFLGATRAIRRLRPTITIDLVGDFRERWFARMLGSRQHVHIGWDRDHPYTRLIRNPLGVGRPFLTVPANRMSVYGAYQAMLNKLAPATSENNTQPIPVVKATSAGCALSVGIHPFASQPNKLWPAENWRSLTRELLTRGCEVTAFGAPSEQFLLRALFIEFQERVTISTGSIPQFAEALTRLDVLVGLDSFAVHMAHRQGVRSVTINAGTPVGLWAVPSGRTLGSAGGCAHYPCYNVPACGGTAYEYACVKSVNPLEVLEAILSGPAGHQAEKLA